MNRRISDLLDNIQEDSIEFRETTPLSSERIKVLTMQKINVKQEKTRTIKGTASKVLVAAILICSLAVTASAASYSAQATDGARGQVLDKNGNILKDVPLSKNVEMVQGDTVVTDIVLLDDGNYIYVEEIEEVPVSSDAEWWGRFNSLTPDQQTSINFRPNTELREPGKLFPKETTGR